MGSKKKKETFQEGWSLFKTYIKHILKVKSAEVMAEWTADRTQPKGKEEC